MKLLLIPCLLALSLLTACATGSDRLAPTPIDVKVAPVTVTPEQVDSAVAKVQKITQATCRVIPTAESIARVAATFLGGGAVVDIASTVADGLCKAFASQTPKFGRRARGPVKAIFKAPDGTRITVHGRRV